MKTINAITFKKMLENGHLNLSINKAYVDSLNVFPVPDGDTGTNMTATMKSGWDSISNVEATSVSQLASDFAMGLLMGARGNSGVILSQIFRGIAKELEGKDEVTLLEFAKSLQVGSNYAYAAILKPTEGTILTVIRETAHEAPFLVNSNTSAEVLVTSLNKTMEKSLDNTPELLPILKEVGVVDSGGMGLYKIFKGFESVFTGEEIVASEAIELNLEHSIFAHFDTDEITHQFCTEFILKLDDQATFDNARVRLYLETMGDSIVVVEDRGVVKVHLHTDFPKDVFAKAETVGTLVSTKAEDMKKQHSHMIEETDINILKDGVAMVAVSSGVGLTSAFIEKGVAKVISGGQTMNPSTRDFVDAINELQEKKIIILPNNSNIILAAQQVVTLMPEREIIVLNSKSMNQALAVLNVYDPHSDYNSMIEYMEEIIDEVSVGEVTYAIKSTTINGVDVKENDFMAIHSKNIVATGPELEPVILGLVDEIIKEDKELASVVFGKDFDDALEQKIKNYIEENFDVEVEYINGQQEIYSFLIGVE